MDNYLNILSISDVHMGCNRISPEIIPNNIRKVLFPHLNDDLDILFIVGDWFDTLLNMDSIAGYEATCVINELIELAIKHKFLIRILQGTFVHDRKQNQFFKIKNNVTVNEHGDDIVKVFDVLDIERIKTYDISVMYIPDNSPHKDIMRVVKSMMEECCLSKVDFILNHGYFKHLLPFGMPHEPANTLDADVMSKLVKASVLNGHIHTASVYKSVINNGSFDRLTHGEEEVKGFFKLKYDVKNCTVSHEFIENPYASIFKTINLSKYGDDIESAVIEYSNKLSTIMESVAKDKRVYIRVISDSDVVRQSLMKYTLERYDNITFTSKKHTKDTSSNLMVKLHSVEDLPIISESNITDMIVEFTKNNNIPLDREYVHDKLSYPIASVSYPRLMNNT